MDRIERNIPLCDHTTLKVGGPAEFFASATTEKELIEILEGAQEVHTDIHVLGGGSNVLIPDSGLSGLTIKNMITGWKEVHDGNDVLLTVGAGEVFDGVVAETVEKGYWGLENLSHIPGSVGATPVQNVGAYGVEVGNCITSVRAVHKHTLEMKVFDTAACVFGYRSSFFKTEAGRDYIITAVTFRVSTTPKPKISYRDLAARFNSSETPTIADIRNAVIDIRAKKFPDWHHVGTAGSFFKNPIIPRTTYETLCTTYPDMPNYAVSTDMVKVPLGWILDRVCQLRGIKKGHVGTYEGQALVIVNEGGATAEEIDAFANYVAECVQEKTGITIEREVTKLF